MKKFDSVDKLLETYKSLMPKTVYLVKNKRRYDEAVKAIAEITSCVKQIDNDAMVKVSKDPLTGTSLCLEIRASFVTVYLIDKFCSALKKANNFEVYPRTDGHIGFDIAFNDAFVPAPPHSDNKEVVR